MSKRTLELPEKYSSVAELVEKMVREADARLEEARAGGEVEMASIEREVEAMSRTVEAEVLRVVIQNLDIDRPTVYFDGKAHRRVGRHETTFLTKAGPVKVVRSLYREVGVRNGPTCDAVSARAGAVAECVLPAAAEAMAHFLGHGTSREAEALAAQAGRLPYSRSTFERVGHQVGALAVAARVRVEERLIEEMAVPEAAASVSLSLDRVALPMEEPRARPVGRPKKGAPKRPVECVWRMAFCGTVTLHDAEGNALKTLRYGRMPAGDAEGLVQALVGDVLALLEKKPSLRLVVLLDGAAELEKRVAKELDEGLVGKPFHRLIDFWHVLEKLGAAAALLAPDDAGALRARWKLKLLNSSSAATSILEELKTSGKEAVRVGKTRPVHDAMTYLENGQQRMDYATARRLGLPIGSGNVEATCKSLVHVRMKRSGARWKTTTGEHVLQLRAWALSDRWNEALHHTLRPLRKLVA